MFSKVVSKLTETTFVFEVLTDERESLILIVHRIYFNECYKTNKNAIQIETLKHNIKMDFY